eukprot:scaffold17820_cov49-Cylindrotheca_fusiformis.AAC.1
MEACLASVDVDTHWKSRISVLSGVGVYYASLKAYPINPSFGSRWNDSGMKPMERFCFQKVVQ